MRVLRAMEKKPKPAPKRRKIEANNGALGTVPSQATIDMPNVPLHSTPIPMMRVGIEDIKIQQAKKFAVTQAQQEGWLGSFRSFDSHFGNYLVPVIPTHADLFGTGPSKNS